ncbi:conserved hypothetical protein [Culex quinquefasciatus]|uniref:Protein kintoun n=1 Tax=Culex quinquefasciatus TaxID=7176 RepID=B0XGT6_CULQU|nr:conserved hypothetical protein [Culex quinquefasciatus]|eukprot:XP_001868858.1 conserved hypothetical protein [Culex quinquefasciatus]
MSNLSEPIQLTRDEYRNVTRCLGDENFRKLFAEYCSELSDPENRIQYEKELKMLEAERGYDVKFIKPLPGYVIKTTTKEDNKIFINVCHSDLVGKPVSKATRNSNGQKGLKWSIPYAQTQPRKDYDNRKKSCMVYDVIFHFDTLHLAKQNANFRNLVTDTAIDAVERSFNVPLNNNDLKFPKLQYKGVPKMSIIRQKTNNPLNEKNHCMIEKSAENNDNNDNTDNKENISHTTNNEYITPKFKLVHKKSVDYFEMTNESNNSNVKPDEIVIEVQLPLLNSASDCVLNVAQKELHLISQEPASYKLQVKLPFEVDEKNGSAKFNTDEKTLILSLPVVKTKVSKLIGSDKVASTNENSHLDCYYVGIDENELTEYSIMEHITDKKNKFGKEIEDDSLCIAVSKSTAKQERKLSNMSIEIKTKRISDSECILMEDKNEQGEDKTDHSNNIQENMQKDDITEESGTMDAELNVPEDNIENIQDAKKQKRHSRRKHKKRSLSESCCDQLKHTDPLYDHKGFKYFGIPMVIQGLPGVKIYDSTAVTSKRSSDFDPGACALSSKKKMQ